MTAMQAWINWACGSSPICSLGRKGGGVGALEVNGEVMCI